MGSKAYNAKMRAIDKANGIPRSGGSRSGKSGRHTLRQFVAIDSEGFTHTQKFTCETEDGGSYVYSHCGINLIASSCGLEISDFNPSNRIGISSKDALDFLLTVGKSNPNCIFVVFGASYDFCQWLRGALDKQHVHELNHGHFKEIKGKLRHFSHTEIELGGQYYEIDCRMRKHLQIKRWESRDDKWTKKPLKITIWDVIGFFQGSFVSAMKGYLGESYVDYEMIKANKLKRETFERVPDEGVLEYCRAELRALVLMMNIVRQGCDDLGLSLSRWDGAGSVAGAIYRKQNVGAHLYPKDKHKPEEVQHAINSAFSGGHIEICKIGQHTGEIHHYDVNSAYPAEFCKLPSLNKGEWQHGTGTEEIPRGGTAFTVVKLRWKFPTNCPFYPLFYRQQNGAIFYPATGVGWHWLPEVDAAFEFAKRNAGSTIEVLEWWHFRDDEAEFPFDHFIREYYETRKDLVARKETGGLEKMIKLGLNSCYGKTAQQVGAREDEDGVLRAPRYFQLEWAGMVTSGCRAKLMLAAMQEPDAIISFATDGLFSLKPLNVPMTFDAQGKQIKILGQWEYQLHEYMAIVQAGVYTVDKTMMCRGFNKHQFEFEHLIEGWKKIHKGEIQCEVAEKSTRMINFGLALMSPNYWKMRGCFASTERAVRLDGRSEKRVGLAIYKGARPWLRFYAINPKATNVDYDYWLIESTPYKVDFGTVQGERKTDADIEEVHEEMDAEHALNDYDWTEHGADN